MLPTVELAELEQQYATRGALHEECLVTSSRC